MKTYIQPAIVIENLATRYTVCNTVSSNIIPGFGEPGGGDGPQ